MAEKKVTKKEMFARLLAVTAIAEDAEMKTFVEHELDLLNKATTGEKKPTARQVENEELKTKLYDFLVEKEAPTTIAEMQETNFLKGKTTQRIVSLLKKLVDEGTVTKEVIKKVTFYTAVVGGEEEAEGEAPSA